MRIRPLFILADLESGGAQRVILTVIRNLNRLDFEPHLALINSNGPLAKEIPEDLCVHHLGARRVRYALPGIYRLCKSLRPEAVISTLGHLNLSLLAVSFILPTHTRFIVREANTPSIRLRYSRRPWLYRFLYRILYPHAFCVICNSDYMKKDLIDSFALSLNKICVIPNPVDTGRIDQIISQGGNPYKRGKYHILSIGRLTHQKGFDLLLKSFNMALKRRSHIHLTIVGEGPEEMSLKGMVEDLAMTDDVTFAGHQHDPFSYMAHADLFVSSSRWEGLPNVVLESLACGTPVLAFDCPGGTSEIIKPEENGWLVPSGDTEAMVEKFIDIVDGKEQLKFKKGTLLRDEYTCRNVLGKYEELLRQTQSLSHATC